MKYFFLTVLLALNVQASTLDFTVNGTAKAAKVDTGTPANTIPVPMRIHGTNGVAVDPATETTLSSIDLKLPVLGQHAMAGSLSVTIASDQTAVQVSGPLTDTQLRATAVTVSGPLTNTQLRASPVPVSATAFDIRALDFATDSVDVSGSLLTVANTVSVDVTSSVLPTGAATEATLASLNAKVTAVNTGAVTISAALPAGNNNIGDVDVATLPVAFNAGSASATTQRVVIVTDQTSIPIVPGVPAAVTAKQAAISIGTSAVRLTTDASAPSATRRRLEFQLDPDSTANCYYGSSSVTTSSTTRGVKVFPAATKEFLNDPNDYYAICDVAAQTFFVVEAE